MRYFDQIINNNQLQKKNIVEIKDPKEKKEKVDSDSDVEIMICNTNKL